jgi:hypothetical protein
MGDFLIKAYDEATGTNERTEPKHTAKKVIVAGLCVLALGASFVGGVVWEYTAEREEIADIEAVALEACNARIKTLQKLCKKGC